MTLTGAKIGAKPPAFHLSCVELLAFFAICRDHRSTMREWNPVRTIPYHLPWVLGIAVVMAVTGPFGSYETMGLGKRLLYFTAIGVLAWAQVIGFIVVFRRAFGTGAGGGTTGSRASSASIAQPSHGVTSRAPEPDARPHAASRHRADERARLR